MACLALFPAVEEMGSISVIGVTGHARLPHATGSGFIQQRQGKRGFGLKGDRLRHGRLRAPRRILRPRWGQLQPPRHRPGQRALGILTIARDLTGGQFARRPGLLPPHADRGPPLLLNPRILTDEHPIPCAGKRLPLGDSLAGEGGLIPDQVGQQMIELLPSGLGHDLRQGVAVFVGVLTAPAGAILAQGLGPRPLGKMPPQWRQKLGQLRQRGTRGLRQPLLLRVLGDHSRRVSQIYGL